MRGMIFAAGRGERMGALTKDTPKPLLKVAGRYLIEYSIAALHAAGIQDIIINICYRAEQIKAALGDGKRYGVNIQYSEEIEALETGGAIYKALPLLGSDPFVVVSCDIITDFAFQELPRQPKELGHIVMVPNPPYHPTGDFCLDGNRVCIAAHSTLTFSNIGVYRPELFQHCKPGKFRLGTLLRQTIEQHKITGERFDGQWHNLGTPEDLAKANLLMQSFI